MSASAKVTAFYTRIWNAGGYDAIRDIAHPDFTFRGSLGVETKGHDAFIAYARAIRASLEGYQCDILGCVCNGDQAFAKMQFGGRHVQSFFGFEPSGLHVQWLGAAHFRFERDRIADLWVLGDLYSLEKQLRLNQGQVSGA